MNDNETVPEKRRKLKVSNILIILLLIGLAAFAVFRLRLRSKLRARMAAIRAAGYPVTCAELDKWYTIPENAENAAYTIIDAFSYYKLWGKDKSKPLPVVGRAKLPARTEPLPEEMKAVINQYVTDNNEALELLHTGAAIKHCRYPVDFTRGFEASIPYLSDMRSAARLLAVEAILHADNDDPESAARSVISVFGVARSLTEEPMIISQLVRISHQALALSVIERAINRTEFTDDQLLELARAVAEAENRSTMVRAFAGERCQVLSGLREPASLDGALFGTDLPPAPILELYKALGLADMDALIYLDLTNEYIEAASLPLHKRENAARAIEVKYQKISQIHVLLHILMPAISRVYTIELRGIAHLRSARVALAVQRYRLASGKLPDTLGDLVPAYLQAVPTDPFDGKELRYKKLEAGFVVYSIGEDLSDDGGKEMPKDSKERRNSKWDATFIVER